MKTCAQLLAGRRQQLVAECEYQRAALAMHLQPLNSTLHSVQTGMRIMNRIRQHPGWLVAFAAGLYVVKPRRLSALLQLGISSLRTWQKVGPVVLQLLSRH